MAIIIIIMMIVSERVYTFMQIMCIGNVLKRGSGTVLSHTTRDTNLIET